MMLQPQLQLCSIQVSQLTQNYTKTKIYRLFMKFNQQLANSFIEKVYWESYIPSLSQFVAIPNTSRLYDPQWATNGLLEKAGTHIQQWIQGLGIKGLSSEIIKLNGFSPLLFVEIEGQIPQKTILYYGHFDKQPHMGGWDLDKGPTKPVTQNGCLYGRGVGDDGYAAYTSALAIKSVQDQGIPLPRIVMIIEGDQESGNHIETYFQTLRERLGKIDIVFCFDSSVQDYERVWITKSIRGFIDFQVQIKTLKQGVHSGDASGIAPSTFKVANILLNRLQDLQTGKVNKFFQVDIPSQRYQQIYELAKVKDKQSMDKIMKAEGLKYVSQNALDLYLNRTWRPQITVIGLNGFPQVKNAGNVMLPQLKFKVNLRVPPTFTFQGAKEYVENLLTKDAPFNCSISALNFDTAKGWSCNRYQNWLQNIIHQSSKNIFNLNSLSVSDGGSVPIISILANQYKQSQIIVTGVLGPNSNAHGPNECMNLAYTLKFTQSMTQILAQTALHYWSQKA